jgi:hypothetical protein
MNKWTWLDKYAMHLMKEILMPLGKLSFQYLGLVLWLPLVAIKGR